MFKVEFRKDCKVCGNTITHKRSRTYCSAYCRVHYHNSKPENIARGVIWQRTKRDKEAEKPSPNKIKCEICGKYYVQVGTHIIQVHKYKTAREYRKEYGFDLKKGQLPQWYKKLKAEQVTKEALDNLKNGRKFWFKPGDKQAGRYERSEETMKRLSKLHTLNK
jgi:hypothetical protein